jgi:hypothetical protein
MASDSPTQVPILMINSRTVDLNSLDQALLQIVDPLFWVGGQGTFAGTELTENAQSACCAGTHQG